MTDNTFALPPGHLEQLQVLIAPYTEDAAGIEIAIVGGSQVLQDKDGNLLATKKSDIDFLGIARHVKHPVSLTAYLDGQKYDVIIRDPATLLWDFMNDRNLGRGTLMHITCFGQVVHGAGLAVDRIQQIARDFHAAGPLAVYEESAHARNVKLFHQLTLNSNKSNNHRLIASLIIGHDLGHGTLRLARHWTGKGKMIARMYDNDDELRSLLDYIEDGMDAYTAGDAEPLHAFNANATRQWHHKVAENAVPFFVPQRSVRLDFLNADHDGIDADLSAAAFTNVRTNPHLIGPYLHNRAIPGPRPIQLMNGFAHMARHAALVWLHCKHEIVTSAVTVERLGRSPREYRFALARLIDLVVTFAHLSRHGSRSNGLDAKIHHALHEHPQLADSVRTALDGDPTHVLAIAQKAQYRLIDRHSPPSLEDPRYSPSYHRVRPAVLDLYNMSI